jgi:hypothetical protein
MTGLAPVMFPGEREALQYAASLADIYGYGNLIAWLKRAWALKLMAHSLGLTYEKAVMATDTPAYPERMPE